MYLECEKCGATKDIVIDPECCTYCKTCYVEEVKADWARDLDEYAQEVTKLPPGKQVQTVMELKNHSKKFLEDYDKEKKEE